MGGPCALFCSTRVARGCPTFPTQTLEATPQRLREHDAVLRDAVAAEYSVVPSLFGRLHADDASLGVALERSAESLDEAMALVQGRVEMSLLVAAVGRDPS